KGEAEAIRIKGEAESNYNQKVAASLTPTLIQQQYLLKWDGKLPQFSAGGSTPGMLLNIPGPAAAKP
ncbi:MAG TPA: prohibitin family protein, partial [Candidatus Methylomirabilis sp.]|nr:prohibitin family protein [Candidatus Methylomirabilis sp.]